jgi:hypothetical protein
MINGRNRRNKQETSEQHKPIPLPSFGRGARRLAREAGQKDNIYVAQETNCHPRRGRSAKAA